MSAIASSAARSKPSSKEKNPGRDLLVVWRHYKPYHRSILLDGASAAFATLAELSLLAILVTITSMIGSDERQYIAKPFGVNIVLTTGQLLLVAAALVLVRGAFSQLDTFLASALGSRYEDRKRAELMDAFLGASWPVQADQRSNELQDVVNGAVTYGRIGVKALASATGYICSVAIMLVGAVTVSWVATVAAITLSLGFSFLLQPLVRRSKHISTDVRNASLRYAANLGETVLLAREIRLAGVEHKFADRLQQVSSRIRQSRTREQVLIGTAPNAFEAGTILLVLAGLGTLYILEMENTARFVALLLLLLRASQYGRSLQGVYHQMKGIVPYLEMIDEREAELESSTPASGMRTVETFHTLHLSKVTYRYGDDHDALTDLDITISANEVIGVIGPSGSGKTTLVEMILGLRSPASGHITLDGVDLNEIKIDSWCRLTGLVSQDSQLVEGTLADNVRFFRDTISDADIDAAVVASGLDRDLRSLPNGLTTAIGTRSSGLSGGQRQRLAIARVLAGRPQLLVLDEPTSALDVHAEAVVTDTLERLRGSTTIVVVAHRLSTLRVCDKVIVLRDGRVDAFASRSELERDNEYYSAAIALAQLS